MRNITVAVPEDVYRRARVRAAQAGTSVSQLVAEFLRSLSPEADEFELLRRQQHLVQREIRSFNGGDRLTRDEAHVRALR